MNDRISNSISGFWVTIFIQALFILVFRGLIATVKGAEKKKRGFGAGARAPRGFIACSRQLASIKSMQGVIRLEKIENLRDQLEEIGDYL